MEYTLSITTFAAMLLNILLGIAIPVLMYVFCRKKYLCDNRSFLAGCSTMIAIGLLVDVLLSYFFAPTAAGQYLARHPWIQALFTGLVAAVVREPIRYLCARFFLQEELWNDRNALMFAAGYGTMSILTATLISTGTNLLLAQMVLKGQVGVYLENLSPENLEVARETLITLCETPAWSYLLLTLEQCLVIAANGALVVLIWFAVQRGRHGGAYLLMAMGLHFMMEFFNVVTGSYVSSSILTFLIQLLLTAGTVSVAWQVWKKEFTPLPDELEKEK